MTNIAQLMQDSEVMRMLKIGNPERSKDFDAADPGIGLFEIERRLKQPLEGMISQSEDPDGAIAQFDTALMLNNMGIGMQQAHQMARLGFASSVTGIDTKDKNYWEALKTTAQHSHWQDMKGITTSLYRITGNRDFLHMADEYEGKIRTTPVLNSYGEVGDLVLDSVQPAMSSLKFIATTAMLSWIPGGVANKIWGPAIARTVAKGGGLAANMVNWFATGYSQAGDVLYNVMQMEDAEGNKLPWDSVEGGTLFHGLAGLMGLVELGSMEMFPWYRQLKTRFTNRELLKHIERGFASSVKSFLWKGSMGTLSESGEEGIQTGLSIGFENALKAMANKDGAEFDLLSLGDSFKEAAKATYDAGKSMLLTSFLTAGVGQGAYSARLRASSKKNFSTSKDSIPIEASFVGVPKSKLDEVEDGSVSGPIEPIKVVNVGTHLAPADEVELGKAARAMKNRAEAMEVVVEDMAPMDTSDQLSILNRAAVATEAKIVNGQMLGFETEEDLNRAAFLLASNTEAMERTSEGIEITIRSEDGTLSTLSMGLIGEGQEAEDPDIAYVDDPEAPYSLSRMTEERALEWKERQVIKQAIGDVVSHTGGRISTADLEANVDAIKLVADTLNIPTDRMLTDNLVFKLEKASPKGERGAIDNITVDGIKRYTIHVSEHADASTILHEMGHFMRGTASREQLAAFTHYYGGGGDAVWLEDINKVGDKYVVGDREFSTFEEASYLVKANEETFADDFVVYLRTGDAPTQGLRNFFRRMKAVLQRFVREFGYRLDPQVKQAFDRLFTDGRQGVQGSFGAIPTDVDGNVLFQATPQEHSSEHRQLLEKTHVLLKENGQFKTFYHGGETLIEEFDPNRRGSNTAADDAEQGYFFTSNREVAQGYAEAAFPQQRVERLSKEVQRLRDLELEAMDEGNDDLSESYGKQAEDIEDRINEIQTRMDTGRYVGEGAVTEVHLALENPLVIEYGGKEKESFMDFIGQAIREGNDGVIVREVYDSVESDKLSDVVVVFEADKIHSLPLFQSAPPTDSEAFKAWFGDSKVVDEQGNPLVVYHGSPITGIEVFDNQYRLNEGEPGTVYASNSYEMADSFAYQQLPGNSSLRYKPGKRGHVYPLYMSITKPLDFRMLREEDFDNFEKAIKKYGYWKEVQLQTLEDIRHPKKFYAQRYMKFVGMDVVSHLEEYGYDGVIVEMRNDGPLEFACISPSQVKSVGNVGTWDPNNPNILYQRARDPYREWEPEITDTGKIKGAPEWVKDRRDLNTMRRLLRKLVKEGESGRFWYEESAEEVWRITQGDPEKAKKFIQLLAIYSPNNNVPNNTLMAIRAYNHWAAGLPEDELHSGMGELDAKAKRALYHNEDWIGRKTGSFYENLMYELVRNYPEAFEDMDISDVATMDLWMARAFGYLVEAYSDDKGSGKYSFSENSTRRLAAEMNGKLKGSEVPWTPHQIQAAIWSSMKTRYELPHVKAKTNKESVRKGYSTIENGKVRNPSSGESEKLHKQLWRKHALEDAGTSEQVTKLVEQTGFSFKEAIYDSSQIVTWEAIPSASLGHGITSASMDVKKRFTDEARALIVDMEGNDLLAGKLGVPLAFAAKGDGAYDGAITPNVLSNLFPTRVQGQKLSFETVRMYARAIQYIFKQDAVPFFKPDSTPISSKADQEELYFKVVRYTRDEKGEIAKATTIPKSRFSSQGEAENFREKYLKRKKGVAAEDVQVHGGKFARAVVFTFKNDVDDGILEDVLKELQQYLGDEVGYTRTGGNEITLINFRDDFTHAPWMHDEEFLDSLDFFNEDNRNRFGIVDAEKIFTEGEYGPVYDWSESKRKETEGHLAGSFSGRPDLHTWIRDRRTLFEEILERYSGETFRDSEGESGRIDSTPTGKILFQKGFEKLEPVTFNGITYLRHDPGASYAKEDLDAIAAGVQKDLDQISEQPGLQYSFDFLGNGKIESADRSGTDDLHSHDRRSDHRGYSNLRGWDGSEETPTIDGDWKRFRRIDFSGTFVGSPQDVAKLFSIYRNPQVEFFHVILTKEEADGYSIVNHHALSSGLPTHTLAVTERFPHDIHQMMEESGADGYFILHNHPSGKVDPSHDDMNITRRYANALSGFNGHIILDHNTYTLIDKNLFIHIEKTKGFHRIPQRKHIASIQFTPEGVAEYALTTMTERKGLLLFLDGQARVFSAEPVDSIDIDELYRRVYEESYASVIYVTRDVDDYRQAVLDHGQESFERGTLFTDVVLLDGSKVVSAFERDESGMHGVPWVDLHMFVNRSRMTDFVFENHKLYQLSDVEKQSLLDARKQEVMDAVQNFYWIPDEILEEYTGEQWADDEIRFRQHLKTYPWILEEARKFSDTDEFLDYLQMHTEMGDYKWVLEDELWFKRVHAYSRIMSPKDKDAQFARLHTGTDAALIALGKRLRGYEDVEHVGNAGRRKGGAQQRVVFKWGSFNGVSPIVKRLNESSSAEEIQKARALIQESPRPYRRALQVIEQAQDRVLEMRGLAPSMEASRDAYYDSLGEEMEGALNEPLLLNQMTDRQAAEYLRTTTDTRQRYNARERLATHTGILAMEQQANAELKKLGAEKDQDIGKLRKQLVKANTDLKDVSQELRNEKKALRASQSALDKERARSWELVEKLDKAKRKASKAGRLERDLADRRARVEALRKQVSIKSEEVRKLKTKVELLDEKLKRRRLLVALEGLHNQILATVKFNPDMIDASFEEAFNSIHRLFDQNQRPGKWELLPQQMGQYIDDVQLHYIQQGKKINQWTLGELETLYEAARMMRMDAKVMLEKKKLQRMDRLQNIASQMYRQTYGQLPEVGPGYGSLMNDIIDDLMLKRDTYDENIFDAMFNTMRASIGKMQRISRMIDGNQEGIVYQLLVRDAYERMTGELRESYRRLQEADARMKELGITNEYLAKKAFTYTTPSGQEKTLAKGEVIGLFVYSQNPLGAQKLMHNRGNNIPFDQLSEAIESLTSEDKAWGDYMVDSLGGDEVWERMRRTYYDVYNRNLGRRKRYFTFVADGKVDEGKTDLLVGPQGSKIRYVDKDFTKIVNPHAVYPLKLNVTHTFTSQIKKQEHFIQWADWTRDMNYLLTKGAVGRIIEMNHGPKFLNAVQEYVNDVGSPQVILDDIERIGSKIISNAAVAALSLNFLTMLKQLPSFSAALRGDIGAMELLDVALRLSNPKTHAEAVKFIHEMSPYMLKRSISVEVEKYNASDFDSFFGRKVQTFNEQIGMKGIQIMDQVAVNTLWLASYNTYVRRNPNGLDGEALKQEAAFRATQLISETQPTSIANDLSSLQRKKSPWVRTALLFSNQLFQYINMIWYDLPTSAKAYIATRNPKELRKMFGIVMNMAISGGMIMLVSGVAFRGDDDDEEYWERIRREVFKMIASYSLPIVGNAVSQGISGFYGGDLVDLPTAVGRTVGAAVSDWDKMNKRLWDLLDGIGSVGGLPTAFINRAVKSVQNRNPFELLGATYGDLWEAR